MNSKPLILASLLLAAFLINLETTDDAMSASKAPADPARRANGHEPNPLPTHTPGTEHG